MKEKQNGRFEENNAVYTQTYYKNEGKLLRRIVDSIVTKHFPNIPQFMMDEFHSVANEVFVKCLNDYDESNKATFRTYLYRCLENSIKSRVTHDNRQKRGGEYKIESLNQPIGAAEDWDGRTLEDVVESPTSIEDEVINEICGDREDYVDEYIGTLSRATRDIANMIASGWNREDLRNNWGITNKQYENCIAEMRKPENVLNFRRRRSKKKK